MIYNYIVSDPTIFYNNINALGVTQGRAEFLNQANNIGSYWVLAY